MSVLLKDGRKVIASNFTEGGSVEVREVGCCETFTIKADEVDESSGLLDPMGVIKDLVSSIGSRGVTDELTTFLVKEAKFISMVGSSGSLKDMVTLLSMYKNMLSAFNKELENLKMSFEDAKQAYGLVEDDEAFSYWQDRVNQVVAIQEKFTL